MIDKNKLHQNYLNTSLLKVSDYPNNFIPKDARIIIGIDYSKECSITVKGFYNKNTGEFHFQEVESDIYD